MAFVTGFSGAIMPGPLLVAVIGQTPAQGMKGMAGLIGGHAVLEFFLLILLILGLRAVLQRPPVRAAIGLVGGVALLLMSIDMLRQGWGMSLELGTEGAVAYSWAELMVLGAVICAANPYFIGWWGTIGVGQLAQTAPRTKPEYLAFYLAHEAADFTWYGAVALVIVTGERWLTDGIYRGLIIVCGGILVVLSGWFLYTGFRLIMPQGLNGAGTGEVPPAV